MKRKSGSGKASVTLSTDTKLTDIDNFADMVYGRTANTTTRDLIDINGASLKPSKEKGSAPLQRFVQQSDQNNLDERKAAWKVLTEP